MTAGVRNFKYSIVHKNQRIIVCPRAFELIHGISRYWRKELIRDINGASEVVRFRSKRTSATKSTKKQVKAMLQNDALGGFEVSHLLAMGTMASTERTHTVSL